jgi:hypothetical protein
LSAFEIQITNTSTTVDEHGNAVTMTWYGGTTSCPPVQISVVINASGIPQPITTIIP